MKSTLSKEPYKDDEPIKYPCLMVYDGTELVVLVTSKDKGVVVCGGDGWDRIGSYYTTLDMGNFKPYEGSVCLEND